MTQLKMLWIVFASPSSRPNQKTSTWKTSLPVLTLPRSTTSTQHYSINSSLMSLNSISLSPAQKISWDSAKRRWNLLTLASTSPSL
ncbi:hypothetical protein B0F90DRAFT_1750875, partial [Multifurca ochricompacta]